MEALWFGYWFYNVCVLQCWWSGGGVLRNDYHYRVCVCWGGASAGMRSFGFPFVSLVKMILFSYRCDKNLLKHCLMEFSLGARADIQQPVQVFRCDAGYGCHVDLFNYKFICLFISGRHCVLVRDKLIRTCFIHLFMDCFIQIVVWLQFDIMSRVICT